MDRMSKKRFNELNVYLSKKLVEICKIKKIHKINNIVWYNDEKLFFKGIISLGINEEKNVLMCSYIEKIKPMWIDNLLWDIMNMSDNEKNAQSLRANGAFTYNGYQTDFKSTVVETWSEMEIEKCICNYLFDDRLSSQVQQNQRKNFLSTSKGVRKLRRFLGRLLIISTKCCRSSSVTSAKEVPFGKNCRSRPLVFSFVPRCQGE